MSSGNAYGGPTSRSTADSELLHALPAVLAHRVPTADEFLAIASDVLRRRLQREVRHGEAQIFEERLRRVFLRVLLQTLDRVVGEGRRGVVARAEPYGR